jgi:PAS domain S-box-containing protein
MKRPKLPIDPSDAHLHETPSSGAMPPNAPGLHSLADPQDRQALLGQLIEAAPNGMVMADKRGAILLVNAQIEKAFGYVREELLGQPIEILIPERYRSKHPQFRDGFVANPTARPMGTGRDLYGLRKDGTEFPVEIGLNPLETEQGMVVLGTIVDITERKKAELSLRASQERLKAVVDAALDGIILMDHEGRIVDFNPAAEQIFGYSRDDVIGESLAEKIIPSKFREQHRLGLRRFQTTGEGQVLGHRLELQAVRSDGTEFPVELSISRVGSTEPPLFTGFIRDITEPKLAETRLRESKDQLAGVIGSAMDAIISVDGEHRIVLFNAAAERMFMFPAEDAIGQQLDRFIPPRFHDVHKQHIEKFGRTNVTRRSMGSLGALFGLRADGTEFPIEASISQLESDGQKIFTVILRDITERKRSEEALREQATILDLAPVLIFNLDHQIIFWNTGAEKMYGWRSEDAVGKIASELLKTEFPIPLEKIKAQVFARGHWEGELVHTTQDGRSITLASTWVLHKDKDGKPRAFLQINNEITERKTAEEEIRRLNTELELRVEQRTAQLIAVNRELEAFSYSVSHDLRAPLRHINGFSRALMEDYAGTLDEVGNGYLNEICDASREMSKMIDDVLKLARVTRSEMKDEPVDLTAMANDIVEDLKTLDPDRVVDVRIEPNIQVSGDKRLLEFVVGNLIGNAWKFTSGRPAGAIEFGTEVSNGNKVLFIKDNGAGFDMRYADKLFGAFQRLHSTEEFEGTGVGLATVKRIIERHGGRVWAEAEPDKGATFYFTLAEKGAKAE